MTATDVYGSIGTGFYCAKVLHSCHIQPNRIIFFEVLSLLRCKSHIYTQTQRKWKNLKPLEHRQSLLKRAEKKRNEQNLNRQNEREKEWRKCGEKNRQTFLKDFNPYKVNEEKKAIIKSNACSALAAFIPFDGIV